MRTQVTGERVAANISECAESGQTSTIKRNKEEERIEDDIYRESRIGD